MATPDLNRWKLKLTTSVQMIISGITIEGGKSLYLVLSSRSWRNENRNNNGKNVPILVPQQTIPKILDAEEELCGTNAFALETACLLWLHGFVWQVHFVYTGTCFFPFVHDCHTIVIQFLLIIYYCAYTLHSFEGISYNDRLLFCKLNKQTIRS